MKSKDSILNDLIKPSDFCKYLTNNNKQIKKNTILFNQSDVPLGMYYLINGSVKISNVCKKEKKRVLKIASEGDILGIEACIKGLSHSATAIVIEDSTICFISITDLSEIIKHHPFICFELLVKLYKYLLTEDKRIYLVSIKTVEEKLSEIISEQNISSFTNTTSDLLIHKNLKIEEKTHLDKSVKNAQKANYFQLKIKQLIC